MKKVLAKSLALAFVGSLFVAGSAMATPTGADYYTPIHDSVVAMDFDFTGFFGTFGLYTVNEAGDTVTSEFEVFSGLDGFGYETVYFDYDDSTDVWSVSLDNDWTDTDNEIFDDTFGFYFSDTSVDPYEMYYTCSIFNDGGVDPISIDYGGLTGLGHNAIITYDYNGQSQTVIAHDVAPVPEPATMLLFGTGMVGLAGFSRRRKSKK